MGISIWELLVILLIVVVLFGTKKLRSIGSDLGSAIKNFRESMKEGSEEGKKSDEEVSALGKSERVIEGQVSRHENKTS